MVAQTVYQRRVAPEPVAGVKVQGMQGGFGETLAAPIARVGQAVDKLAEHMDETATMELDAGLGQAARGIERNFLATSQRNAMDGAAAANAAWDKTASDFLAKAGSERQREMLSAQIARRREAWADRSGAHVARETEAWTSGTESAWLATMTTDATTTAVGTVDRADGLMNLGHALDQIADRRGYSPEERRLLGFQTLETVHVSTIQQLLETDPAGAKTYLDEHADQISPEKLAVLRPRVRDEAVSFTARSLVDGGLFAATPEHPTAEVDQGDGRVTMRVISPITGGFDVRHAYGEARTNHTHGGVDLHAAPNTTVVAALPGTVHYRTDPNGYGRYMVVDHGNGVETVYAHLAAYNVADGTRVEQGQAIARSGGVRGAEGSGNSQAPHLHFEYRVNGQKRDPAAVVGHDAPAGSAPATGRPHGQTFTTVDDIETFATAHDGGDWRLHDAIVAQGRRRLGESRAARSDSESEAARRKDQYILDHPDASFDQVVAAVPGMSPSERVSLRTQLDRAEPVTPEDRRASNDLYNIRAAEAAADPGLFLSRDLAADRAVLGESKYQALMADRVHLATARPTGGQTVDQTLSLVDAEVKRAAEGIGIETAPSKQDEHDAQRLTDLNVYMRQFATAYAAAHDGQPPPLEQLRGALRLGVVQVQTRAGETTFAAAADAGGGRVVIPRDDRQAVEWGLRQAGRPTTDQAIQDAYRGAVQRGTLSELLQRYRHR